MLDLFWTCWFTICFQCDDSFVVLIDSTLLCRIPLILKKSFPQDLRHGLINFDQFSLFWAHCIYFLFPGKLVTAPCSNIIIAPVCFLQSLCIANDTSSFHFTTMRSVGCIISFNYCTSFKHFSMHFNFPKSSSSGHFTLVVRSAMRVWMSHLALAIIKNSWVILWWNAIACSLGSRNDSFCESQTWNR